MRQVGEFNISHLFNKN